MTILSNRQIIDRLGDSVIIEPFNPDNVNTSSYDVTLGEYYFIEHPPKWWQRLMFWRRQVYNIWDYDEVRRVWGEPKQATYDYDYGSPVIWIPPGHTILAHTVEFIGGKVPVSIEPLPIYATENRNNPSTSFMQARSSFGRNFITVCCCAGYGDVGYTNRWTMEITNRSRFYHLPLVVGRRIAQIVFSETGELTDPKADYTLTGKYQTTLYMDELQTKWRPEMMLPRLDRDREIKRPKIISTPPSAAYFWGKCHAVQFSDTMVCERCQLRWDTNDPDPPKCGSLGSRPPMPPAAYFYDQPQCPHGFQDWDLCPQCGRANRRSIPPPMTEEQAAKLRRYKNG